MKLKICSECKKECYLFSSRPALCSSCARKYQKPINKVSEKRAVENKEYSKLRREYLTKYPECQIKLIGCSNISTEIHHKHSGKDRASNFLKVETWLSTCRFCHNQVHNTLSMEQNLKLVTKL